MAIPPIAPVHDGNANSRIFDKTRLVSLARVVGAARFVRCVLLDHARRRWRIFPFSIGQGRAASLAGNKTLVDLRPWQTAEALAPLAVTAEETEYAHQAEHLADHEVDQAFASALRQANLKAQHRTFTGEALALSQKVEQLKQLVAQDQAQVDSLTSALSPAAAPSEARQINQMPTVTILRLQRRNWA